MNVEELLSKKGIPYAPKGQDFIVNCLSPEHDDHNPSMRIDRVTGVFNCFSCRFKGNLFYLYGEKPNQLQLRREKLKNLIKQKMAESVGLVFPSNSSMYSGNWRGIKPETYKKFDAFLNKEKNFSGRINFPIKDFTGKIVAYIGRHTADGTPKYLFTPPGSKIPLFPTVKPKDGSIILVEGIFDMLNLYDKGLENVVCCFGTKNVDEDKLSTLRMSGVSRVELFFDGDDAGQNAAKRVKEMCQNLDIPTTNIFYGETVDPGNLALNQVITLGARLYG